MNNTMCVVFFEDGLHQVIHLVQGNLVESAEAYISKGTPYLLMNTADLPPRETRNQWSFDYSKPDGFGKAEEK